MNDQPDPPDPSNPPTQPLQPDPGHRVLPPDPTLQGAGSPPPPPPRQRFVDRVWSLRAVIAVALASVILGGLGGAALASAGDDADQRRGPGPGFQRGGPNVPPPGMRYWRDDQGQREWRHRQRPNPGDGGPGVVPRRPGAPTPTPARPTPSS